jgi:hypothetical protein
LDSYITSDVNAKVVLTAKGIQSVLSSSFIRDELKFWTLLLKDLVIVVCNILVVVVAVRALSKDGSKLEKSMQSATQNIETLQIQLKAEQLELRQTQYLFDARIDSLKNSK